MRERNSAPETNAAKVLSAIYKGDRMTKNDKNTDFCGGKPLFDNLEEYYKILSSDYPYFIDKYFSLELLSRLKGVGLLCGTDWTPLFNNRFFYSRFDHSVAVALITWNFTKSRKQTLAALLHDVSTPAFSHVGDFRVGDALTQVATEGANDFMVRDDVDLGMILNSDGLYSTEVGDYHRYPVADNEIPSLSADRLEYMFPSGMALDGTWNLDEIRDVYDDISLMLDENKKPELGFCTKEIAEIYCKKFCHVGILVQKNENKVAMQLLADICSLAVKLKILGERDFFKFGEADLIKKFETEAQKMKDSDNADENLFSRYFRTFRTMKEIKRSDSALDGHFCVNLAVKRRYIDPLVIVDSRSGVRLHTISAKAAECIDEVLHYEDSPYGCVPLVS